MKNLLIRWGIIAIAVWLTAALLSGITLTGGVTGILLVALVFGFFNAIIKPIVKLLTCPLVILTLGLFTLVINTLMLELTAQILPQYLSVDSFWWALIGSILISIVTALLGVFIKDED